jgi:S1-C subfamily serine protease
MSTPFEPPQEPTPPPATPPAWAPFEPSQLPPGPPFLYDPPQRRRSRALIVTAAVTAVLLAVGGGMGIGWTLARIFVTPQFASGSNPLSLPPATASGGATNGTVSNSTLAKVEAAIVDVDTQVETAGGLTPAAGTGMILTSGGEILTNNHVIEGATTIRVSVQGRSSEYTAHVVGADPTADVALIQLEGVSGLPTVKVAPASALKVGAAVVALGNALGQGGTPSVTEGTITNLGQDITASTDNGDSEQLTGMIESDAPISPGDSGGALIDSGGEVLGMITAGQTRGFRSQTSSIGYAIPVATAMAVVKQVRSGHATDQVLIGQPGYIGVEVQDLDAQTATQLGLSVSSGVLVTGLQAGSPAEAAGIAANSVITAINGTATPDVNALGQQIHKHHPGDRISVSWTDQSGGTHTASMTLISGPAV